MQAGERCRYCAGVSRTLRASTLFVAPRKSLSFRQICALCDRHGQWADTAKDFQSGVNKVHLSGFTGITGFPDLSAS